MKKFLLASICLVAFGAASASAADIQRRQAMPAKAPVYVAQGYNWSGPYIGISGGYAWGSGEGGIVGGTLGYNLQTGPWVFGLEGDLSGTWIDGSNACGATTCTTRNHWLGTARGRLGYAMGATGSVMPYFTGGAAFGDIQNSVAGVGTVSDTSTGWTLGGGIEAAIAGPLTAKIEYLYVDLGDGPALAGNTSSFHSNIVRAGLNYRF